MKTYSTMDGLEVELINEDLPLEKQVTVTSKEGNLQVRSYWNGDLVEISDGCNLICLDHSMRELLATMLEVLEKEIV